MKKYLSVLFAATMLISLCGCSSGKSKSESTKAETSSANETVEATTAKETEISTEATTFKEKINLTDVCNWVTSDIWNKGFCDISHYVEDGKSSTGETMDIEFTISNLKNAMDKKDDYNKFILSLDDSIAEQEQLKEAWKKMIEQVDMLYNQVINTTPTAADKTYSFDTGLFKQYYDTFYKLSLNIKDPVISDSGAVSAEKSTVQ
jgi:hypothetical protein